MDDLTIELGKIVSRKNVKCNEQMSKHTTFKTGGPAEYFVKVNSKNQIQDILKLAKKKNVEIHIIGNGSNLIVKDEGIKGIVLKIEIDNLEIFENDNEDIYVNVGSGFKMMQLAQTLKQNGITGFEELSGIPRNCGWGK